MAHARKRIRKLSTAVFRGVKSTYSFDVFPITTGITDHPVVFIFSRRQIDKGGRAHHLVSCVGETQSIVSEIKKHKRARCVKGNAANVVCILKEPNSVTRSTVLDDIAAVRTFSCVRGTIKTNIKAKPNARKPSVAKVFAFKPAKPAAKTRVARIAAPSVAAAKPSSRKRVAAATAKRESKPRPKPTSKKAKPAADRARVQSGMGSDGGQRRLSNQKRIATRRAKTGAAGNTRSRTKLAA